MKQTAFLSTVAALALALPAQAEFSLADRYTDTDGDLVADIPDDESQWLDPARSSSPIPRSRTRRSMPMCGRAFSTTWPR